LRNPLAPIRNAAHLLGLLGSEDERVREGRGKERARAQAHELPGVGDERQ